MEKEFDVHGWDYTNALEWIHKINDGYKWLDRSDEPGRQHSADTDYLVLKETVRPIVGKATIGKAFGLALAKLIFCRSKHHSKFYIPEWFEIRRPITKHHACWSLYQNEIYIVRSSYREEDWMDPRSGVGTSVVCYGNADALEQVNERVSRSEVCVVQRFDRGCGCVIDVGYSELLERPIVRVARGNKGIYGNGYRYTSPTWDHEAHVAIYDANTADKLYGSDLGFDSDYDPFPEMVKELVSKLRDAGWIAEFGFQFEIAVDPIETSRPWRMVQMRPSPGAIRGMSSKPQISGTLISTTGKVNKAGTASGELWSDRFSSDERLHHKAQELSGGWRAEGFDLKGKVILWDYASLKYNAAQTIHGAGLAGAEAQITGHNLFTNSGHGTYSPYSDKGLELKAWEEGKSLGLQFGRIGDHSMVSRLQAAVRKETVKLLLVSDGLVGQIYKLD